jgi:hypothetical protein
MSKFKIKMKLTGFELEIEGSKEDVPNIQQALSQQLGGLLQPAPGLLDEAPQSPMRTIEPEPIATPAIRNGKARKRSAAPASSRIANPDTDTTLENWPRDVSKYVSPQQSWNTKTKALWLLYVAQKENIASEVSGVVIRNTFNLHYRQAKTVTLSNVNRDLGKVKGTLVGEDVRVSPPAWFLTEAGLAEAERLISEVKSNGAK